MPGSISCPIRGGVIRHVPYGDDGPATVEVYLSRHPYLRCLCGDLLDHGFTTAGAFIWICHPCERILDQRRVA